MHKLNLQIVNEDFMDIFHAIDEDHNGKIDYHELLKFSGFQENTPRAAELAKVRAVAATARSVAPTARSGTATDRSVTATARSGALALAPLQHLDPSAVRPLRRAEAVRVTGELERPSSCRLQMRPRKKSNIHP
jgi:hypothetical protein